MIVTHRGQQIAVKLTANSKIPQSLTLELILDSRRQRGSDSSSARRRTFRALKSGHCGLTFRRFNVGMVRRRKRMRNSIRTMLQLP